jgi:hypothetical protein
MKLKVAGHGVLLKAPVGADGVAKLYKPIVRSEVKFYMDIREVFEQISGIDLYSNINLSSHRKKRTTFKILRIDCCQAFLGSLKLEEKR